MSAAVIAALALAGFAVSNALETALLTLSFTEEKNILKSVSKRPVFKPLVKIYRWAFDEWRRHPSNFLAAILITQTLFSMLWCVIGLSRFKPVPAAPLAVGGALFLFGELVPKVLARRFPAKIIIVLAPPFYSFFTALRRIFLPFAQRLEKFTDWHLAKTVKQPFTEKEIRLLLKDRELTRDLRPRSRLILELMLEFSSARVKEAMRPAAEVFVLDTNSGSLEEMLARIVDKAYSRIPAAPGAALDKTTGILYAKDLLFTFATGGLVNLHDIIRECPVVEENQRLGETLDRFRRDAIHIALVKDKTGKVKGIISLEDIVEKIVGEIRDEYR
ncbi:MAG: DUF21 domain-containing protein [Elusimicrobia bacterium]|nr:DUF21 domain-containing protein [Elusimicrobiota bacterium]